MPEPAVTIAPPKAANPQPRTRPPAPAPPTRAPAGIPPAVGPLGLRPSAGTPLPPVVAKPLEQRFGADLARVRVHTDAYAAQAARAAGARAFTVGDDIFLAAGERVEPGNALIAHEVAHTIQQRAAPRRQPFTDRGGDRYEHEARGAAAAVTRGESFIVRERTTTCLQRLGLSDALDYFADKANLIPGFRMFTIILGVNPVNMSRVDRSAANILRAVIEFIPGGGLITRALDAYGVFDRVGAWVEQQIRTLGMTGSVIRDAINRFLDSLSWTDIFDLGGVWERAKRIFSEPIDRIISFLGGLVTGIVTLIKDAILRPLAELAKGTRGWDLLTAVLGRDPITGDAVPRTAETLIGGFMKLIGQDEVWENIKRANAIPRAWAWFQGALGSLVSLVSSLPSRFLAALRDLVLEDIVLLVGAFAKVGRVFAGFIGDFLSWAGQQVLKLLEIIFEVLAPAVMPYLRKAMGAFSTIIRNPIGFVGNLVRAGVTGFRQFAAGFLGHLRTSLIQWLTGTLSGAGIYIPQAFELREVIKFVLSVLGLTWQNIRGKLVRVIGEPAVGALERGFDIVMTLVREGPAAAWEKIRESIGNLRDMVMGQVMEFVRTRIVQAAITRLVTSLNPAGAFIQAIIAIYNTIMFVVERLRQIAQVVAAFVDSIAAIAAGAVSAAANRVEQTMAGLLTLVISFLARLVGLGNVSEVVLNIVRRIRAPVDRAIDRVAEWIVATARRLGRLAVQAGVPADPAARLRQGMRAATTAVTALSSSRRLERSLIEPVLAGLKVRYGFQSLQALRRNEQWWIRGTTNPTDEQQIVEATDEELQLLDDGQLSVDARRTLLNSARRVVGVEAVIATLLGSVRTGASRKDGAVRVLNLLVSRNLAGGYTLNTKEKYRAVGRAFEMDYYGAFLSTNTIRVAHVRRDGSPGTANYPFGWAWLEVPSGAGGSTPTKVIKFDFLVHRTVEQAGIRGVGSKMFSLAATHFATQFQGVGGDWLKLDFYARGGRPGMSTNLVEYLDARRRGLGKLEAARQTWTFRRVVALYAPGEVEVVDVREDIRDINNLRPGEGVHVILRPKAG